MAFRKRGVPAVVSLLLLAGCARHSDESIPRAEIEAAIARGVEATRTQDIEAYMALIPEDAILRVDTGRSSPEINSGPTRFATGALSRGHFQSGWPSTRST